ncbi:hypothetical protein Tco_1456600 [Tanacetum coccineum]
MEESSITLIAKSTIFDQSRKLEWSVTSSSSLLQYINSDTPLNPDETQSTIQDVQGEIQQVDKLELLNATTAKVKARQCTQPKRTRNAAWYKEKVMLAEAQEAGQILEEEQLAFHAEP